MREHVFLFCTMGTRTHVTLSERKRMQVRGVNWVGYWVLAGKEGWSGLCFLEVARGARVGPWRAGGQLARVEAQREFEITRRKTSKISRSTSTRTERQRAESTPTSLRNTVGQRIRPYGSSFGMPQSSQLANLQAPLSCGIYNQRKIWYTNHGKEGNRSPCIPDSYLTSELVSRKGTSRTCAQSQVPYI
jgi:hypothetical protein